MVMMKFLPKVCKGWGKGMASVLLSKNKETTKEMEALVCWYVEIYGASRWAPEFREDEEKKSKGERIERRGKRSGEVAKDMREKGPVVFMKYWNHVNNRRGASKDWDQALQDAAKSEQAAAEVDAPTGGDEESEHTGTRKKKQRKQAPEPVIPSNYRFESDGTVVEVGETAQI